METQHDLQEGEYQLHQDPSLQGQSYAPLYHQEEQRILCASCGTAIAPNAANMCLNCIRSDVDISEGIPKQATIHFCKGCDR